MIFLGLMFRREQEAKILENTPSKSIQNQANSFEWNVIDGFRKNGINDIKIINVLPVGTFPNGYRKLILKDEIWDEYNIEIGSLNLPFVKQYVRYRKIKKIVENTCDKTIVIYSTYLPFLKAVSRLSNNIQIVLIVTDLPEYYDLTKTSCIKSFFRKLNNKKIYKYLERVDKYVLLTEQMKDRLPVNKKPYTVVEGIIGDINEFTKHDNNHSKFIVTYSGTLNSCFGIKNLIDSIVALNNEKIELHLFGNGDAVNFIREISYKNPNIIFHGFVPKSEIDEFYQQTNLLVNPRKNDGDYTKYSFPSKTMEYLLSGIPFLGYRLDGIPEEYYDYINIIQNDSVEAISDAVTAIYENYDFYIERARKGRQFVVDNKNNKEQTRKIIDLINYTK